MSLTKSCRLALVGVALLAAAATGQAKVIVFGAALGAPAADSGGALRRVSRQPDSGSGYPQPGYRMLEFAQYTVQNLPTAGQDDMKSFRELSDNSTPRAGNSRYLSDSYGRSTSPTGTTDAWIALLILCGLTAYQLRRKQQLLKRLPFSA